MTENNEFELVQGDMAVLPYSPKDGAIREGALLELYQKLKDEGLFEIVFHENPELTATDFLNFFHSPRNLLLIFAVLRDGKFDPAGMAWIADVTNCQDRLTRAVGSFVFFRDYQVPRYTDHFGVRTLDFWFNHLHIDTLAGVTPVANRLALGYIRRLGLREVGRLPQYTTLFNEVTDAVVTCLTKGEWQSRMEATRGQESGQVG